MANRWAEGLYEPSGLGFLPLKQRFEQHISGFYSDILQTMTSVIWPFTTSRCIYLFIYFLHTAQYTRLSRGKSSALYAYTHTLIFFGPLQPWFEKLYVSHPGALPLRSVWTNRKRSWQDLSKRIETCGSVEPITERLSPARFELVVVSVWRSTKPEYDQSDTEQRRMS